jgi:RIO-like serine/threonine protein kinase
MELVRMNKEKGRSVFYNNDHYVKIWDNISPEWIIEHVQLLKDIVPGYVIDHGINWIAFKEISGVPASTFNHSVEFVQRIQQFCLDNIKQTYPYAHGDWTLSNMIIDNSTITMIDWDNVGIYPEEEVYNKMNSDLKSAFGNLYVL